MTDCPRCFGNAKVDEDNCKTSYPCTHQATCELCGHTFGVYGVGSDAGGCGPFYLDLVEAMTASQKLGGGH